MKRQLEILAVGDNLIHKEIYLSAYREDGSYCFDSIYAPVKNFINKADIRIVNQETVFIDKETEYASFPIFATPLSVADALAKAGFNVVTHASNHALDKGQRGLRVSLNYWRKNHPEVEIVGIYEKGAPQRPTVIERNGVKVAILNYTESLNGHFLMPFDDYRVNRLRNSDKKKIAEQISTAKKQADIVVVCPHWGCEYLYEPINRQKEWATFFAQCNVDLVIGTHPHVLQPLEILQRADGKKMPVYFSLGNFVSCQVKAGTALGGMARIVFEKDELGCHIKEQELIPLIMHADEGFKSFGVYFLKDYSDAMASSNQIFKAVKRIRGVDMSYGSQKKLYEDILSYKAKSYSEYKTPRDVYWANIKSIYYLLIGKKK